MSETTMDAEQAVPVDGRDELDEQLAEQLKRKGRVWLARTGCWAG